VEKWHLGIDEIQHPVFSEIWFCIHDRSGSPTMVVASGIWGGFIDVGKFIALSSNATVRTRMKIDSAKHRKMGFWTGESFESCGYNDPIVIHVCTPRTRIHT